MSKYDWLLFLHLLGAFALVAGIVTYHLLQLVAVRRERPTEVAALLGLGRVAEMAIRAGAVVVLVFGIWLAYVGTEIPQYKVTDEWVLAAIVLWVLATGLGERAGRIYGEAQKLARRLANEGDAPSSELRTLLRSPRAALLMWASNAAVVTILVLMIWKPGAP